ncbi:hypothetical protein LTSEINV_4585 [Salmonella enterica subsp. enterica serovar Inverness str. R8-3668]|uniref:Uncharacterized protein n=1 Tax=Salmonella enterica subsp. enterica serovar Inverness str. R8-3668 TaxID=913075 RepID=G5NHX1_SALET|nr:hypothetical protein LTSEINV_4585 [Salmonella enterica subsp. enterica serovar Inverness str. R8-3668]
MNKNNIKIDLYHFHLFTGETPHPLFTERKNVKSLSAIFYRT